MTTSSALKRRAGARLREQFIRGVLFACASLSIITTIAIVFVLSNETIGFFREVPIWDFLTGTEWTPLFNPPRFGVLPLLSGTLMITVGAAAVALPVGLATAIYLSEYASDRVRNTLKPVLEILAGVPTVVYGYFALTAVTPVIRVFLPETHIFNAASASFVVGLMVLPMVTSLADDALRAVPQSLRDGGYALSGTKLEVSLRIVLPAALSGVIAGFVLAVSRAIGETMAVTLAAGATPNITLNPLESIQTMTAYMVQVSLGDTPHGTIEYRTLFAVGTLLFVITLSMNVFASRVLDRFREVYE